MKLHDQAYLAIYEKEEGHWWFRGRRAVLSELLKVLDLPARADILDVGCGTGGNLVFLKAYGNVDGCDYAEEALRYCAMRGFNHVRQADICDLPYTDESYDLITCLDVIEHVRLDTVAFSELARITRLGEYIIVTLPVNPRLYSSFDCLCGHLRRYTFEDMRVIAAANDLRLARTSCYTSLAHPVVRYYMYRGDLEKGRGDLDRGMESGLPGSNALLTALCRLEARLLRHVDLPWVLPSSPSSARGQVFNLEFPSNYW